MGEDRTNPSVNLDASPITVTSDQGGSASGVLIQGELPLERPVGHAPFALQ